MSDENVITDVESLVDFVLGDESENDHHSPDTEGNTAETQVPQDAPEVKDDADEFDPYGENEESPFAEDSAENQQDNEHDKPSEQAPATADSAAEKEEKTTQQPEVDYQQEINKLTKRLHDTQKAFHESTERAAQLQKRLDAIEEKSKQSAAEEDGDNWFSDSDNKEVAALKQEISDIQKDNEALGQQQQEIQQQANLAAWHQAAASVRQEHEDFDELVYEKLEPLLDEETGDARVRELYLSQKDLSPAGAYKFARSLPMILEMLNDPEAFHAKIESLKKEVKSRASDAPVRKVTGNDGLRVMNSADFAEESRSASGSLIDEIFG
jgi:chromosome segregation ATPase